MRDATGGSKLPLRIRPGALTSSIDIAASGDVGIGTAAPNVGGAARALTIMALDNAGFAALELQGSQNSDTASGALRFYNKTNLNAQIAAAREGADNTASLRFLTANAGAASERMRILPTGHVGIGTVTPNLGGGARTLTIATPTGGTGDFATLELQGSQNTNSASGAVRFYNKNNLTAQIAGAREGADNTASLRFLTANAGVISEKMRILPSGFVGIGTVTPSTMLHVVGDATVTGALHVSGPCCGPDYVFAPGFPLASIEENAAYMCKHRHLPAVGPARTTPEGDAIVDVFAQSKGMLEELEKAHIYIGQLHREIEALKALAAARDSELKRELAELRRAVATR